MPEPQKRASLSEVATGVGRRLGEPETQATGALDEVSDEEIRAELKARGLELRKTRSQKGVVAAVNEATGKIRLTVDVPKDLRLAVKSASFAVNKTESVIAEEAFTLWMEHNNLRV